MQKYFHNKTNCYKINQSACFTWHVFKKNSAKFQNETASRLNGYIQQKAEPICKFILAHSFFIPTQCRLSAILP